MTRSWCSGLLLLSAIVLIQRPDFDTRTLQIEEVAEDVYLVIDQNGSKTIQIMNVEEDTEWIRDTE